MKKIILISILSILLISGCVYEASLTNDDLSQKDTSKEQVSNPEEKLIGKEISNVKVIINSIEYPKSINSEQEALGWFIPKEGNENVRIDLTIENNYEDFDNIKFTLKDSEGYSYPESPLAGPSTIAQFLAWDLDKGDISRGIRIFEVKTGVELISLKMITFNYETLNSFEQTIDLNNKY